MDSQARPSQAKRGAAVNVLTSTERKTHMDGLRRRELCFMCCICLHEVQTNKQCRSSTLHRARMMKTRLIFRKRVDADF